MSKKVVEKVSPLVALAKDLSEVLKIDPPLDLAATNLKEQIVELIPEIKTGDALSEDSWTMLKELGWKDTKAPKVPRMAKASIKKEKTQKAPKEPKGPSNKAIVYGSWKNGKGETDVTKLLAKVDGAVKESTIRGWLNQWKHKKNLPASANK